MSPPGRPTLGRPGHVVTRHRRRARSRPVITRKAPSGLAPMESEKAMTIKVGDTIPSMKLMMATADGPKEVSTDDIFSGKKVVLFAVPGAFTPTCSAKHLPGFVENAEELKKKGVDAIACVSVNDAFVMGVWGEQQHAADKVMMLADGNGDFTKALGLDMD